MSETKKQDLRTVRLSSKADLPPGFRVHTDVRRWIPWKWIPVLNRYVLLEIVGPFLTALFFFTFIYMAMAIQKMIGLFVGKGVDFFRLLDYFGYLLGNTLPATIPMACLMGGIMAAGRLSSDSEVTAMRSAGISFSKIYSNFLIFGFIATVTVGYMNFYLGPENARKMNEFNNWIMTYNPMLAVTPGQFSGSQVKDNFEEKAKTMYTEGLNRDTGEMKNIQIREWEIFPGGSDYLVHNGVMITMGGSRITQIISAKKGYTVEKINSKGEYEKGIRLKEGFAIEWNEKKDGFTITNFMDGEMDYNVPSDKEKKVLGFNIKPETFPFPELIKIKKSIETEGIEEIPGLEILKENNIKIKGVKDFKDFISRMELELVQGFADKSIPSEDLNNRFAIVTQLKSLLKDTHRVLAAFGVEIHKRIASPVSCMIFFFLSFPLGLVVKRSGKGMSFTVAIVVLFTYYAVMIICSGFSLKNQLPYFVGPWIANVLALSAGFYFMLTRTDIHPGNTAPGRFYKKVRSRLREKISPYHAKIMQKMEPVLKRLAVLRLKAAPVFEKIKSVLGKLKFRRKKEKEKL